jgi:predicted esterase
MMKQIVKTVAVVAPLLVLVGCGDSLDAPVTEEVKGGELLVDFSAESMKKSLLSSGVVTEEDSVYGYKAYKVPYITTDEEGNEVEASGLFVVPTGDENFATKGISMVSDDHGTIFANREAPTVIADNYGGPDGSAIILTSMGGFATLQADYIGFGDSNEHYHPYLLKKSLASSTIDFIKQVKQFSLDNNITLNNQLFLTGYSEGGYAAMSTLQALEAEPVDGLQVSMAAPMSGPYFMSGLAGAVLQSDTIGIPSFVADIGYAYGIAYDQNLSTIINEPYASKLPTLLLGDYNRTQVDAELTTVTKGENGLFTDSFVSSYFTGQSWFNVAMAENDVYKWSASTPVALVHCKGDTVVPYAMSELTEGNMTAEGSASVTLYPVEDTINYFNAMAGSPNPMLPYLDHAECGVYAYVVTNGIFKQYRQATVGY